MELQAVREVVVPHIPHEGGLHLRQVETAARQVRLRACNLNGSSALCGTNVEECPVAIPGEGLRQCAGGEQAAGRHACQEDVLAAVVGIEALIVLGAKAALRLASGQCMPKKVPVSVVSGIEMLQQPTKIGRCVAHEIQIGLGRVHVVACLIPMKQAKRDQGIEEIAGASWMNPSSAGKNGKLQSACRERREDIEFH